MPWLDKLKPLAEELDVIAIHTYPVWEYKGIEEGLAYTIENYKAVAEAYPDKQIIMLAGQPMPMDLVLIRKMLTRSSKSSTTKN